MHAHRPDRSRRRFTATRRDYDTNPDYDDDEFFTAAGRRRRGYPRGGKFGDDQSFEEHEGEEAQERARLRKLAEGYDAEDDKWALDVDIDGV